MVTVSVTVDDNVSNNHPATFFSTIRLRFSQVRHTLRSAVKFRRTKKRSRSTEADKGEKEKINANQTSAATWCGFKIAIDPSLPCYYRWLVIVSLAVLYNLFFVIGRAVFWDVNNFIPPLWFALDYISDAIYILDILVRLHEGYLEQGLVVEDPKKLRRNYIDSKKWRLDLLSLLPTDFIYYWWSPYNCHFQVPCAALVRINRAIKFPRLWDFFDRTETDTNFPNVFRICKVLFIIVVLIHWNACFYFAISYSVGFGADGWVYNGPKSSVLSQYIYSFYWSMLTLTTIGGTPVPENDTEIMFVIADFLGGVLIFAIIVGNIGSMISNMNLARVEFQNKMDGVKQYMTFTKVGSDLEERVIKWFAYTWAESGALDEESVLAALPDKLKLEIAVKVHLDTLRKVTIFQDCDPGLLEALVLKLQLQVFSPGDYICRKGDVGKELYIVKRGRLQVVADDGTTVFATLEAGSVFGEVSVLDIAGNKIGNRRTANVRSLGFSDLFCLAKDDLWNALADYPDTKASLIQRGCEILRTNKLLDEEIFERSYRYQNCMEESILRVQNKAQEFQTRLNNFLTEFNASQIKLQRLTKKDLRFEKNKNQPSTLHTTTRQRSFKAKKSTATDAVSRHKTM